jgi:hypothetical protein
VSVFPELRNSLLAADTTWLFNNQRNISLTFTGFKPVFSVADNPESPLQGQTPVIQIVEDEATTDLWWSPIPYEFLYQPVTTTQVEVTSNGIVGLCLLNSCDFKYVENHPAVIELFSIDAMEIHIEGTDLP